MKGGADRLGSCTDLGGPGDPEHGVGAEMDNMQINAPLCFLELCSAGSLKRSQNDQGDRSDLLARKDRAVWGSGLK